MICSLKNGSFYFECEGFKYSIYMKNDRNEFSLPKEDIIDFRVKFLNKEKCKISFDDEQSISYILNDIVQFETVGTVMHINYDICKNAIIDYLNKF
jgi:hypothetical protein